MQTLWHVYFPHAQSAKIQMTLAIRTTSDPLSMAGAVRGAARSLDPDQPLAVRIETLPEMRVAFIRHVGPYEQTDSAYAKLMAWAGRRGLLRAETEVFGIAYDDPQVTAAEQLRYDAALVVPPEVAPEGEVSIQTITGGKCAVVTHSGRELSPDPALEFYRNTPADTATTDLITDIYRLQENETTKRRRTRRGEEEESLGFLLFLRALRLFVVLFFFLKAIYICGSWFEPLRE